MAACIPFHPSSDIVCIGARFAGYCRAPIKDIHNGDFDSNDGDALFPHGCYAYRVLWGLNICGEDTKTTFAQLLKRCKEGENYPMCHGIPTLYDDEV